MDTKTLSFPTDPTFLGTLQQPLQLWDQLGSFWRKILTDTELLGYHQFAKLQNHGDVLLYARAIEAATSIETITPFVQRQWRLITLLESELVQSPNLLQYGSGRTYGDGAIYGQVAGNSFVWVLPEDIAAIGYIVDNVLAPTNIFDLSNSSYDPETNQLKFAVNPFTLVTPSPVYDGNGTQTDNQIQLFCRNVLEDQRLPFLRFGSIINVQGTSSGNYVRVLQAVWSLLVRGPSMQALLQGLLASAGLPYCAGGETVQVIQTDSEGLAIVTDQNVYRYAASASPLVAVGDALVEGQALVDTLEVFELGSGATPDFSSLKGLSLGPGLCTIPGSPRGELIAPNLDGSFTWTGSDAQFTLYGAPSDIAAFWADVAARGVTAGKTFAQCVGVSATSGTVPVNPLTFVIDNVLGNNTILISMKPAAFLDQIPSFMARITSLIPAGTLLLTYIQLETVSDQYSLANSPTLATVYNAVGAIPPEVIAPTGGNLTYSASVPRCWIT